MEKILAIFWGSPLRTHTFCHESIHYLNAQVCNKTRLLHCINVLALQILFLWWWKETVCSTYLQMHGDHCSVAAPSPLSIMFERYNTNAVAQEGTKLPFSLSGTSFSKYYQWCRSSHIVVIPTLLKVMYAPDLFDF